MTTTHREPFATDVSEGKSHPIYNAHAYHTKVPHRAIMRYILRTTEPGDVVRRILRNGDDGRQTQLCQGDRREVESLGLNVKDSTISTETGEPVSVLGERSSIIGDLAPVATFIASNYNRTPAAETYETAANSLLSEVEDSLGWMFATLHNAADEEVERLASELGKNYPAAVCAHLLTNYLNRLGTK